MVKRSFIMHTTSINVTIQNVIHSVKRVERMSARKLFYVPNVIKSFLDSYLTRQAQKISFATADACSKLQLISLAIQRSDDSELLDPSLEKYNSIEELKQLILVQMTNLREDFLNIDPDGYVMPKFHKEISSLVTLSGEFFDIATELQWAIAEHDASNSPHRVGFVASSTTELDTILDRISAG